jgi:polyhydroxybutyrate depolymerase
MIINKWHLLILLQSCVFLFTSCKRDGEAAGIFKGEFRHNGLDRKYIFYSPRNLAKDAPLVVVLHGFTSTAEKIMDYSAMNVIAKEEGFAVVYPQGTEDGDSKTFWNVGYDFHSNVETDDTGYIVELVGCLQEEHSLSRENIFITGMSNGGEMCYLLACKNPNIFRAAAPVAGTMMKHFFDDCDTPDPIPLLAIFGTKDDVTNYNGDIDNEDGWGAYQSIPFITSFWTSMINVDARKTDTLADAVIEDSSFVIREHYLNSNTGNDYLFYRVEGGGHDWPGAWGNMDINASREIWTFFERHQR